MKNKESLNKFIQYIEIERDLNNNTIKQYIKQIGKFLSFFKDKTIKEITTSDVRAYLAFHKKNGIWNKPATFIIHIIAIRAFFKFLHTEGIIEDNPAIKIKIPFQRREQEIKYIDKDELKRIIKILETVRYHNKDRAIFHLLLSTGMRVNELVSLTKDKSYINIEERKIFLPKTKSRRPHYIMFSKEAQYYLKLYLIEDQISKSKYLFHENKKPISRIKVWKMLNKVIHLAFPYGWNKPYGPHLLRHTFATDWVSSGGNLIGLQSIMGWHNLQMTEVYVHQSEELVTNAYDEYEKKKKQKERYAKKVKTVQVATKTESVRAMLSMR